MNIKELLKNLEYSDADIDKITTGMKENNIHTASEENLDIRYSKLKEQKTQLEADLIEANKTLKDLKKNNGDIEGLQAKITEYQTKMQNLEAERQLDQKQFDIKSKLLEANCTDMDYIMYKLGDLSKLDIEKDLDNKIKELKENNSTFFKVEEVKKETVLENKLPSGETSNEADDIANLFKNALNGNI